MKIQAARDNGQSTREWTTQSDSTIISVCLATRILLQHFHRRGYGFGCCEIANKPYLFKQRFRFPITFVVELANDNIGYIPDRRSYAEGNYEPESARCAAGSGEKVVETAVQLLQRLYDEK